MQLIGMLDSPYVRRVAVSLLRLGLPFEHRPLSVFRTYDAFAAINPVVRAPSLVCDDGTVLMDSTLILDHAESLAPPERRLMPQGQSDRLHALRVMGLALAAAEKAVQIVYERSLRPPEKQHRPWIERVEGQLRAACTALEAEWRAAPPDAAFGQAAITSATMWFFIRESVAGHLAVDQHPTLQALSVQAEQRAEFIAAPHGDGLVQPLRG